MIELFVHMRWDTRAGAAEEVAQMSPAEVLAELDGMPLTSCMTRATMDLPQQHHCPHGSATAWYDACACVVSENGRAYPGHAVKYATPAGKPRHAARRCDAAQRC